MTPKFYGTLWMIFFAAVGVMWLGGGMSLLATLTFGFISFGLVWAGMICVLPGMFGHNALHAEGETVTATEMARTAPARVAPVRHKMA